MKEIKALLFLLLLKLFIVADDNINLLLLRDSEAIVVRVGNSLDNRDAALTEGKSSHHAIPLTVVGELHIPAESNRGWHQGARVDQVDHPHMKVAVPNHPSEVLPRVVECLRQLLESSNRCFIRNSLGPILKLQAVLAPELRQDSIPLHAIDAVDV